MSQEIQNNQNKGQNFDQEFLQMTKKSVELLQKIDENGKNKKEQLQQAQQIFKEYLKLGHNSNILKSQIKKNSNHNKSSAISENSPRKNNSSQQFISNSQSSFQNQKQQQQQQQNSFQNEQDEILEKENFNLFFQTQKSFFNHREQLQELVRSQHTYKLSNELKYSMSKNVKKYPDHLHEAINEILEFNDEDYEIRDALLKQTNIKISMLQNIKEQLSREYFKTFSLQLNDYSQNSEEIQNLVQKTDEALLEQEDLQRKLKSENFFLNGNQEYQQNFLPQISKIACNNLIIQKTYQKTLLNFNYISPAFLKKNFNEFSNQHFCSRKLKKIRLLNDYLPLLIHLQNLRFPDTSPQKTLQKIQKIHTLRPKYQLPQNMQELSSLLQQFAHKNQIFDDIEIDNGCLLLFQIDHQFPQKVLKQTQEYLTFHPYDVTSTFFHNESTENNYNNNNQNQNNNSNNNNKNNFKNFNKNKQKRVRDLAETLIQSIENQKKQQVQIKVRSSLGWIDKIQILQEKEMEQREQEAIFDNYEDTFVNSWLKFLLCSQQATINTKIEKDMSVLEERANQISKEKLPDAYFEFYKRLLKLIFLKSRESMIKILSYLNFFRCTQKNLNLIYIEMVLNKNIEGSQIDIIKSKFDVNKPIDQHDENPVKDDTFLLTNPAMAHYGNLSNYLFKQKVLDESKEDLIREKGNVKPSNYQEPGILYEEEKIHFIQEKQIIEIFDHNNNKIVYDASVHDFLEILNEVGEICAFFFRFNLKHEQQEQGNKDIFKDNFDRETLIDSILELEQKFQYEKAQLIQTLTKINKSCFTPDLKKSLIELIAKYMTKRPRMDLFEQNVFKCYHYEIENLQIQNEIYKKTLDDLIQEEKQLYQLKININQQAKDKFDEFYYSIQNSNVINVQFYIKSLVKLILNIEQNKQSFDDLIPSTRGSPKKLTSEILKCENDYFKQLLMYTKQIINDCEGMNIFPDYNEFKFIETDQVLDRPENFNLVQSQIKIQVEEKSSEQEQKEFDFDSFSILEFQKVRKKMMNFLFAFSFLMEIYEQQLSILGEDYVQKFQQTHKIGENQQITRKPNYCVGLLDHDKVKIFKEIKELKDWQSTIVQKQKIEDFLIPLESLIILKLMLVSNIVQNNILFDQIKEQYSQNTDEYQEILQISGAKNFANIFTIKEKFSRKAQKTKTKQDLIWKEKLEKLGIMNTFDHETENKKNKKKKGLLPYFSIKLRRELQFQNIKIQTLLQRINLEKLHRKLPFIENMLEFQNIKQPNIKSTQFNLKQDETNNLNYLQVNPASAQYNKVKNTQSDSDNDSENDCMEEQCQFFDSFQSINDIFSLPSVENIISFKHGDFAKILRKYDIQTEEDRNFHKVPKPNKPGEFYEDDNFTMQQSQQDSENQKDELQWNISNQVGGSEWYKLQELKQDKGECLWLSNKAVFQTKYKNQRGFRPRPSFKEKSLLYLKKNSIFNLWTIQNQLTDILTLQIFLVSLEANAMDMILFHNGLLSSADLEIKDKKLTSNKHKTFMDVIHKPLEIPVLKRNELRLRRDLEPLKKLIENLKQNVQWIKKNQNKFIQTDEAIVAYLDKVETRLFLTILHVLLEQMNISRQKKDNEFLHKMRYMLINLNFQQIKCLARSDTDKNIVLQKTVELDDVIEYFPNIPDKILYDNSSEFMKVIQTIFWDNRPKLRQNIHSTNINMQVTRSFFNEQLKTCQVLDRALVGLQQSNATELSTTYARIKQIQNDFLRSIFIFEQDDIFKYERMYTKLIKFFIRYNISKEVYYVRKLKIFPFEVIQNDPLKEKLELWDQKIQKELKGQNIKTIQNQPTLSSKKLEGFQEQEGPEKLVMRKLNAMIFEINKLLMEESLEFYNMKNLQYAKFLQENPTFQVDTTLSTLQYDQLKMLPQQANLSNNKQLCITDENYVQLDLISLLSTFCNQIHFGSIEIETLNQGSALVIPKDNLKSHLSELNNHLVQLMDKKYKQKVKFLEQKAKILQQDVEFQKKQQVLQEKKIIFLEQNTLNLTEAQLAQRTSELQFQLKELKEQLQKYKREEEVREQKLKEQIKKEFVDELESKDAKYKNLYKYFQDFTIVLGKDLNHYITHIKDEKFVHLKKNLQNVVKEFQTGQNALHEVNNQILQNENDQKAYEIPKEKDYYQEQLAKKNEYKQYANQEIDTIILKLQTLQKDYQQNYLDNLQNQQLQTENNNNNPKQNNIINNNNNNNQNLNINNEQGEFYITQQPSNQQLYQQQQQQQIQQQIQQQNLNASVENNKNQNQNNYQNKINQNLYTADDVYWKLNLHERVALENGEFAELYAKFQKLRFYYIYREAKIRKKYEDKIKLIQNQNSSNEELFRKIQELTNQNEQMIQEILSHKKTMSIMEYQNQVLRRDVQRGNKTKMKLFKQKQEIELELEQNLLMQQQQLNTLQQSISVKRNNQTHMIKPSQTKLPQSKSQQNFFAQQQQFAQKSQNNNNGLHQKYNSSQNQQQIFPQTTSNNNSKSNNFNNIHEKKTQKQDTLLQNNEHANYSSNYSYTTGLPQTQQQNNTFQINQLNFRPETAKTSKTITFQNNINNINNNQRPTTAFKKDLKNNNNLKFNKNNNNILNQRAQSSQLQQHPMSSKSQSSILKPKYKVSQKQQLEFELKQQQQYKQI